MTCSCLKLSATNLFKANVRGIAAMAPIRPRRKVQPTDREWFWIAWQSRGRGRDPVENCARVRQNYGMATHWGGQALTSSEAD